MQEVYTLNQLKEAWKSYTTDRVMKTQKDGIWHLRAVGTKLEDGVTSASVVSCKAAMSFPRYLEIYNG